jgi:hypothetical protein
MNVKIGTRAAQFPEKEYINGIFVAVRWDEVIAGSDAKAAIGGEAVSVVPWPPKNGG